MSPGSVPPEPQILAEIAHALGQLGVVHERGERPADQAALGRDLLVHALGLGRQRVDRIRQLGHAVVLLPGGSLAPDTRARLWHTEWVACHVDIGTPQGAAHRSRRAPPAGARALARRRRGRAARRRRRRLAGVGPADAAHGAHRRRPRRDHRGRRRLGARRQRLRHRAPAGDRVGEDHRQGHRGADRGGPARGRGRRPRPARRHRGEGAARAGARPARRRPLAGGRDPRPARPGRARLRAAAGAVHVASSSPPSRSTPPLAQRDMLRARLANNVEQVRVAGESVSRGPGAARQHRHPRAVQRRGDRQVRPAGRDDLADLGRRRLHPHRHRHHRGHGLAGDPGRRQRVVHQPRHRRAAGGGHAERLPGLEDPGLGDRDHPDRRPQQGHGQGAHRHQVEGRAHRARHGRARRVPHDRSRRPAARPAARPAVLVPADAVRAEGANARGLRLRRRPRGAPRRHAGPGGRRRARGR